jgi:Zn-dependent M28 family amino/carboxypeptidase
MSTHNNNKTILILTLFIMLCFHPAPLYAQDDEQVAAHKVGRAPPEIINNISPESLKSSVTYLASDALEGRDTPSKGLNLAAAYIAGQFKAAGLVAVGDDGYFQTADWNLINPQYKAENMQALKLPPIKVRNVVGLLPGSDPVLKDTYVIVSAHYDHLGIQNGNIYNGANDDASGVASVIELARVFASQKNKHKRSLVFMTFFGEEKGLVGSRYYGANPIFPIEHTIAGINLEQLGRTDDSEGAQVKAAGVTGLDFSEVGAIIQAAGIMTGVSIWKHPVNSDKYFAFSDNQALADQGVPAHTISVAYGFPDYHQPGDDSDKIDYDNMAEINRTIALAVSMIANNPQVPRWNAKNQKAKKYLEAWNSHHNTQ